MQSKLHMFSIENAEFKPIVLLFLYVLKRFQPIALILYLFSSVFDDFGSPGSILHLCLNEKRLGSLGALVPSSSSSRYEAP